MLGDIRGRRAGETRVEEVLLRFRLPPRPAGFLLVLPKGRTFGEVIALGPVLASLGKMAGVARVLVERCSEARGVPIRELMSVGGAAASGSVNSSMPSPSASVLGLVECIWDGDLSSPELDCCLASLIKEAGVAGGRPPDPSPVADSGVMDGVDFADDGSGGGRME